MKRPEYHIRWMIRRDVPEVLEIEAASFPSAWDEAEFIRCLRQRNCIRMVVEWGDRIVGYMICELHKNKLNLLNFAVHPGCRRRGVGRAMIEKLVGKLSMQRRVTITLEIVEDNLDGQLFFKAMGFVANRINRNVWGELSTYDMSYELVDVDAVCESLFS